MRKSFCMAVLMTAFIGMFTGCSKPEVPVQEEITIESDYLRLLDEMTAIMQKDTADPVQNLNALRSYIESSQAKAAQTVRALNREVLSMDENARQSWRKSAKPRVEKRLELFAQAQLHLQKRLTEAQKWELGEILALLKQ